MTNHTGAIVEIRRHSARHHDEWGHLTQAGVELAQRVGATMGRFDLVVSSPLPRAAETAIAMGYGVDREIEDLAVVGREHQCCRPVDGGCIRALPTGHPRSDLVEPGQCAAGSEKMRSSLVDGLDSGLVAFGESGQPFAQRR